MSPSFSQEDVSRYLVEALREEVAGLEAELDTLRRSLRFRVGDLVLQIAAAPGFHSIGALRRLLRLVLGARRRQAHRSPGEGRRRLPPEALHASVVVLGSEHPDLDELNDKVWVTEDPVLVAQRLDADAAPGLLVLRRAEPAILRRLERDRSAGWKTLWWPQPDSRDSQALMAYAQGHCDEERRDR